MEALLCSCQRPKAQLNGNTHLLEDFGAVLGTKDKQHDEVDFLDIALAIGRGVACPNRRACCGQGDWLSTA